ncbi:MAG: agmatine deiminase family protein [Epsilonproteobacteria bacterium]|nr:agmatine deiminase family protein [Campylobacterota bacterium]
MIAQWREQKALLLTYPHPNSDWKEYLSEVEHFYDELIKTVSKYQQVLLIVPKGFRKRFNNTTLFEIDTNDTWVRDYGVITSSSGKLLDFGFNGWGLKHKANLDNLVNRKLFNTKKLGFILEGGSIESNGEGVVLTTSSCLLEENRNPHLSKKEIENFLKATLEVKKIFWIENSVLEGDDTDGHIDLFIRFVSAKRLIYIFCEDRNDPRYPFLKKMEEEVKRLPFETIPLPLPKRITFQDEPLPATYANFVIVNGAVIVPLYDDPNDEVVLKLFRELFPSREVIGLDSRILIRQGGAIHCSCMNIFKV